MFCSFQHALQTYSGVYWLDSSGRVTTSNFTDLLSQVQQTHGGLLLTSTGHATFPVTHEQMYKYLPISMEVVKEQEQREATLLFYRTKEMMTHVLPWLAFCALEERCIAPTKGRFCSFHSGAERNTHYANCHRFDQSAVNILMLNYLNSSSSKFYANQRTVKIERFSTNAFKEKKCPLPIKGTSTKSQWITIMNRNIQCFMHKIPMRNELVEYLSHSIKFNCVLQPVPMNCDRTCGFCFCFTGCPHHFDWGHSTGNLACNFIIGLLLINYIRQDLVPIIINSLWDSDAIRSRRSWSTLVEIMVCFLTAPNHYLNQSWLTINGTIFHSF